MTIRELVGNGDFSFNVDYRICEYACGDNEYGSIDYEKEEITVKWDSRTEIGDPPRELMLQDITAINQNDDGSLDIEYVRYEV